MNVPIVIAHRGASAYVPEHTLMAKAIAHAFGADFLEQDVVSSKDGVPLVLHDIQLDTLTDVVVDGIGPKVDDIVSWSTDAILSVSDLTRHAHDCGLAVYPWTFRADALPKDCPSADAVLDACYTQARVDGLFADHPDLALQFLHSADFSE